MYRFTPSASQYSPRGIRDHTRSTHHNTNTALRPPAPPAHEGQRTLPATPTGADKTGLDTDSHYHSLATPPAQPKQACTPHPPVAPYLYVAPAPPTLLYAVLPCPAVPPLLGSPAVVETPCDATAETLAPHLLGCSMSVDTVNENVIRTFPRPPASTGAFTIFAFCTPSGLAPIEASIPAPAAALMVRDSHDSLHKTHTVRTIPYLDLSSPPPSSPAFAHVPIS
ncbi:hypothetical protein PWT90_11209 [Aphanocladium album]|nr:hypothetical protein PWT90_11209 [Aphanocladium album]